MAFQVKADGAAAHDPAIIAQKKLCFGTKSVSVFEQGEHSVCVKTIKAESGSSSPPKPVDVAAPKEKGEYPVILFLHGFFISKSSYSSLIQHIASHGFIVVAPQLYCFISPCSEEDIKSAAAVSNWLLVGLQPLLPDGVEANLRKVALAGHSRGGHAAFSLALGYADTSVKFSVLLGIDPVAGTQFFEIPPKIITGNPGAFNLGIPVLVVGSGLKSACAPKGVNHEEFFTRCNPPACHMVVTDYGHLDMLDDGASKLAKCVCKRGQGDKDLMRRSIGGIVVAFMRAHVDGDYEDLNSIVDGNDPTPAACVIAYKAA